MRACIWRKSELALKPHSIYLQGIDKYIRIYDSIRTPQTHPRFHIGKFLRKAVKTIRKSSKEIWISQSIYVYLCHNNDNNKGYERYRKNKSLG